MDSASKQFGSALFLLFTVYATFTGCKPESVENTSLIDVNATAETKALYANLHALSSSKVLFGHQDDTAYGYTWWAEPGRSDVKEISGSYPAVYGWDIGNLELGNETNLDGVSFENMRNWILEAYVRGGINTISWHMNNPVSGGNSWDASGAINEILPGGNVHEKYKNWLDVFAEFTSTLTDENGVIIPIIFRPFHEHNGSFFWWGKGHLTEQEYIQLWKFTVKYLRDEKQVHNLLWAFSPHRGRSEIADFKNEFMYGFPGADYVDIIGLDNYWDVGHPANMKNNIEQKQDLVDALSIAVGVADSLNKLAALTETGVENIPDSLFWTERILSSFTANEHVKQIAYFLVWRNTNFEKENRDHFYAPYPGHKSVDDFIRFKESDFILFEDELPHMYLINN
ncbi:MAG: glycoside hydrolase family 26 protein [Balneola sp.]